MLDECVTPWLEADMQKINNSVLVATTDIPTTKITCDWRPKDTAATAPLLGQEPTVTPDQESNLIVKLPNPTLLQSSDLAFTAYTLGKDGMSSKYCPYCRLTKAEWTLPPEERLAGELWTLGSLEDMYYDNSKKGAQKLGVKDLPKLKSVEVNNIVICVTHLGIGTGNDTIAAFEDRVEDCIVKIPPEDANRRRWLEGIEKEIEEAREAVRVFNETDDGKLCTNLQQKKRDGGRR